MSKLGSVALFGVINIIIILVLLCMVIYGFILFFKLANRGIKALDLYIAEKEKDKL